MNIQDIQNNIKDIFARIHSKSLTQRSIIQPARDWKLILLIFVVLNGGIIFFSVYLFLQINKGEIFLVESESSATVSAIDQQLLNETLLFFSEKAGRYEDIKDQKPNLPDPSL